MPEGKSYSIAIIARLWSQESGIERASLENTLLRWAADYMVRRNRPAPDMDAEAPLGEWRPPIVHREFPLDRAAIEAFCKEQGLKPPEFWTKATPETRVRARQSLAAESTREARAFAPPAAAEAEAPLISLRTVALGTLGLAASGVLGYVAFNGFLKDPMPPAEPVAEVTLPLNEAKPVAWVGGSTPDLSPIPKDSGLEAMGDGSVEVARAGSAIRAQDAPSGAGRSQDVPLASTPLVAIVAPAPAPAAERAEDLEPAPASRARFEAGTARPAEVQGTLVAEPVSAALASSAVSRTISAADVGIEAASEREIAQVAAVPARSVSLDPPSVSAVDASLVPPAETESAASATSLPESARLLASVEPSARGGVEDDPASAPQVEATAVTAEEPFQGGDRDTVVRLQRALSSAGLYEGAIDGLLGPRSRQALRDLVEEHDIPAVATIDTAFVEQVEGVTRQGQPAPEAAPSDEPAVPVTLPRGASGRDYAVAALKAQKAGQYETAITLYTRAIESKTLPLKAVAHAYNNRAAAWRQRGDPSRALRDYSRAIQILGRYPEAFFNRGAVQLSMGRPEAAVRDFSAAIRIRPGYLKAYAARAKAQEALRQYDQAIADYTEIIRINPGAQRAYIERGRLYGLVGLDALAREDEQTARRLATQSRNDTSLDQPDGTKG